MPYNPYNFMNDNKKLTKAKVKNCCKLLPKGRKGYFTDSIHCISKISQGCIPPDPPRKLVPSVLLMCPPQ